MRTTVLSIVIILTIVACNPVSEETDVINVNIGDARRINFSEWFSGIDIIPLETNPSSLMYACNKMVYEHQRFYIFDQRQRAIFVFDSIGTFLFSTVPLIGQGPGQYTSMTDFCFNSITGNLEFLDPFSSFIRVYDKDGVFIKNITLDASLLPMGKFAQLSSDLYLFYSNAYEQETTKIKVFSVSKKAIVKQILPMPENTRSLPSVNREVFSWLNDNMMFSYTFSNNDVFQIDTMAEVAYHYQYDFGKYTFNPKSLPANQSVAFYRGYDVTHKNDYIFPLRKPENLKYRFCFFTFKDDFYVSRHDKDGLQTDVIFTKFKDGGQILPSLYLDEDYIYNSAEPFWLNEMLSKEMLTPEQQAMVSGMKEDDNTVIIRFKIK